MPEMFVVCVGDPRGHGPELVLKRFSTHSEALDFAERLDVLLGVNHQNSDFSNAEGICALVAEEEWLED